MFPDFLELLISNNIKINGVYYIKLYETIKKIEYSNCVRFLRFNKTLIQISTLQIMSELSLYRCRIDKLVSLKPLKSLEKFYCESNELTKIEKDIFPDSLLHLNLGNNNIIKIENLDNLKSLKNIILSFNEIEKIENLQSLSSLRFLSLNFNKIETIEKNSLPKSLKELCIAYNHIENIDVKCIPKRLESLYLYDNKITKIKKLKRFEFLNYLELRRNPIEKNNEKYLKSLNIKYLRLTEN